MTRSRTTRFTTFALAAVLALALVLVITGCGKKEAVADKGTAMGALSVARSALSTMAPDAKLLLVQTATTVTTTSSPVWAYLFGSPKSNKTYVVYIAEGKSMGAAEYGDAGLSADEWKKVPGTDAWKIDSKAAYDSAVKAAGAKGDPAGYNMGMLMFVPASAEANTSKPFIWYVQFDPGTSGVSTATVEVDAKTGKASVSKQ